LHSHPKQTDSRIKPFFEFWKTEFSKRFGEEYTFTGGKEGKLISSLPAGYDLEKLQRLATQFFESSDPWIDQHGGYTIGLFVSQIAKLVSTSKGKQNQSSRFREMPA
jgi:hypothetical protein